MNILETTGLVLPLHRPIQIDGMNVFDLHYAVRNEAGRNVDNTHGVIHPQVVDQYASSLDRSFCRLTDDELGWRPGFGSNGDESRDVALLDLGAKLFGAALTGGGTAQSYLVLSVRPHEVDLEIAARRRSSTVTHELVHLLQFETDVWKYWPEQGRWGKEDPNWWLHEAVALATEALVEPTPPNWFAWLWDWATLPHRSLDSDLSGRLAAPFLLYLMKSLSRSLGAEIYRLPIETVEPRGTALVDRVLRDNYGRSIAGVDRESMFMDYCVDAGLMGMGPGSVLDEAIATVVGSRVRTEVFNSFPVLGAAVGTGIDHLGCRYFEFHPSAMNVRLHVTVGTENGRAESALRAELVVVLRDGRSVQRWPMKRVEDGLEETVEFCSEKISSVMLVIANHAYGNGWAQASPSEPEASARCLHHSDIPSLTRLTRRVS